MITLEKVSKFIISDMSLHIPKGACVGIIGASGAGKTTLLKVICGLLQPENGYVRTLGKEPVKGKGTYKRDLSVWMVGHSALEDGDTVHQSFVLLQRIYGLQEQAFWQEYEELAVRLDFKEYEGKNLKSLSLGQRMRVELAAAFIGNPSLILLDEPNVGLDENAKAALWKLVQEKCKAGATIVTASHSLTDMSKVCDRIILLDKGRLLYYGSEENLRSKYASTDRMELKLMGKLPDLEDLPLKEYNISETEVELFYDSNYLSAVEILAVVLAQTQVAEVKIIKPDLADIIMQMEGERGNESDRSE
ncbi:MAG: ABC transporter ATP-binding protein [Lachnospiraceae bacterium]|nr:ABC transporter ATP-binding protein [Lachnospiraceae bacterium]